MINPFKDTDWNPDTDARRKFARSLMIGFPIIAAIMALAGRFSSGLWKPGFLWLAIIGFACGAIFWVIPQIAKPFYLVWYFAACCIGIVMSNLLLTLFYYIVITPTGIVMRCLGNDPMRRHKKAGSSHWLPAEKPLDSSRYFRQF